LWNNDNGEKVFVPEEKLQIGGKIDFVEQRQWRQVSAPEKKL